MIVGNPPFLGDKKMLGALGAEYVTRLRRLYQGPVPGGADLVTYWFEKARAQIEAGRLRYAGLVATSSIRGGASRKVLDRIAQTGAIFNAWSELPWINEGANVEVSLVHRSENPETVWCSRGQGLTFIGPAEGLGHGPIEEVDEVGDLCLKVIKRGEIAAADDFPRED